MHALAISCGRHNFELLRNIGVLIPWMTNGEFFGHDFIHEDPDNMLRIEGPAPHPWSMSDVKVKNPATKMTAP